MWDDWAIIEAAQRKADAEDADRRAQDSPERAETPQDAAGSYGQLPSTTSPLREAPEPSERVLRRSPDEDRRGLETYLRILKRLAR